MLSSRLACNKLLRVKSPSEANRLTMKRVMIYISIFHDIIQLEIFFMTFNRYYCVNIYQATTNNNSLSHSACDLFSDWLRIWGCIRKSPLCLESLNLAQMCLRPLLTSYRNKRSMKHLCVELGGACSHNNVEMKFVKCLSALEIWFL